MALTKRALPLHPASFAAQATATPSADLSQPRSYTPPPIPKPLPKPGGPIVQVTGPAPKQSTTGSTTESPASSSAASPAATGGSPQASPAGQSVVSNVNPGAPPQPIGSPQATPAGAPAASATVTLTPDFKFDPAQVTIKAGQTVKWVNKGRAPQTVTADPARAKDKSHAAMPSGAKPFDSGVINGGGSFSHTFDVAGSYSYFSMPQEQSGMLGTVIVQ
jgi:plastocyanin